MTGIVYARYKTWGLYLLFCSSCLLHATRDYGIYKIKLIGLYPLTLYAIPYLVLSVEYYL